ncbi:hypothetical protein GGQ80_000806 [Sphingomonas jinjuensis]|uniref:Uncharacterized protein n=1 Tax=Sphingomonas jinjuensis TaxID=535907 RepID=A0A840FFZ2_9SPHN|nr:hypothetical protein [Sphingomonas jinjuensis]MBB4152918.1 hypothetical protein [Sphingomonas jinjuensis]
MDKIDSVERERQRFHHLVLEQPRPKPSACTRPRGISKSEWKARRHELQLASTRLLPGIEEQVQLREEWGGGRGTAQTVYHADRARKRAGSLARLHASGTVTSEQLIAALDIAETYEAICNHVGIKSSFAFDRVDCSFRPELAGDVLSAGAIRELRYDEWRRSVERFALVVDIIVADVGLTIAARSHRVSDRRARVLLVDALELWILLRGRPRPRPV